MGTSRSRWIDAVAETQNPIEALRVALDTIHITHVSISISKNLEECGSESCQKRSKALGEVKAVVAALRQLGHGENSGCPIEDCLGCAALVPFDAEGP